MNKILRVLEKEKQLKYKDYNVEEGVWNSTAFYLKDKGYIKNITLSINTEYMFAELTEKAYEYLKK